MIVTGVTPNLEVSKSIAVVGSSSNLIGKGYAKIIDSCDDVMRYNRAPVKGYEKHVGYKSTIRFTNHHVFGGSVPDKRFTKEGQPPNFVKLLKNQKIIIGNGNAERRWSNRINKIDESSEAYYVEASVRTSIKNKGNLSKAPSVGIIGIWMLIESGITPLVFGFGVGEAQMTHYWEKRDPAVHHHKFSEEREILEKWHKKGRIILHL